MAEMNEYEVEAKLRQRLRRTTVEAEGGFGIDTNVTLTDEGISKLLDALKLEGLRVVAEE